jgi:hypoxanthine phosphoribosyltransferase
MHVRVSNFPKGGRILLVDEWIDTAATIHTCKTIVEEGEGIAAGIATIGVNRNEKTAGMLDAGKIHCALTV